MSGNPIKDALFAVLESEQFTQLAVQRRYDQIGRRAIPVCYGVVKDMAPRSEILETLATGVLHYILTKSGTPSQRKVTHKGVDIDIVIPGTRELQKNPQDALIIQVCCDCDRIAERLRQTSTIQPIPENVWILTQDCEGPHHYTISGENTTIPDMILRLMRFANKRRHYRLRMAP